MKIILVALLCCLTLHGLDSTPIKCSKEPCEIIKAHEEYESVQTYSHRLLPPGYEIDIYADDFKCEAHTSFTHPDGCNTCFCTDNGKTGGCTKMLCDEPILPVAASNKMCESGEVVEIDGLKCECKEIPNGVSWTCQGRFEPEIQTYSANKCTPGTSYKVDCNTCFCGDNEMAVCTLMECFNAVPYFKREHTLCKIGDTTAMGGKTCKCIDVNVGHAWVCDEAKVETYSSENVCTPGTTYKLDCNTCVCGDNGMSVCTRMACPESEPIDVYAPDFRCEPMQAFKHPDGCNTCHCTKDGKTGGCTKMMCETTKTYAALMENTADPCTPGTTFKLDCNTCVCGDNGMSVCTRMACPESEPIDVYAPDFRCEPMQAFKHPDGCNTCHCTKDGKTGGCTKMMCETTKTYAALMKSTADQCTPGTTFKLDCNTCVCGDNGMSVCTRMACPESEPIDVYAPDFRCEPMQAFKHPDGCNTCHCTKDGKTGGCTRMMCPQM